ncbi:hypothetical protein F6R83_08955 [Citrobacter amalonaticus]|nr:hypothetical protein [Citrobacter amalonaticus]
MQYIINDNIIYNQDSRAITNIKNTDVIILSDTTSRLLSFLIKNGEKVLTRQEILINVWDIYGFKATNSTLTQHISQLRKNFMLTGETAELIITIPRQGFVFTGKIELKNNETATKTIVSKESPETLIELMPSSIIHTKNKKHINSEKTNLPRNISTPYNKRLLFVLFGSINLLFIGLFFYLYTLKNDTPETLAIYKAGTIDECPLYQFYESAMNTFAVRKPVIEKVAKEFLPCRPNSFYYARVENNLAYDGRGRIFLSRCDYFGGEMTQVSNCRNIYFYE